MDTSGYDKEIKQVGNVTFSQSYNRESKVNPKPFKLKNLELQYKDIKFLTLLRTRGCPVD